jgi:DNA-binding beta-propeller fold protein YncE
MKAIVATVAGLLLFVSLANSQSDIILLNKWGEYGSKPGQFKFPAMIATDSWSNVYVVDQHNHRIQKFDSAGNFISMWGRQGSGEGDFNYPYGIAIDSGDNIYISDMNNNRVQKFTSEGKLIASAGMYGSSDGQFRYPYGMAIDKHDILYVIDAFNYRIQMFNTDLAFVGKWGSPEIIGFKLYMPHEIAIDEERNIILSDRQNHRISIFTKDGELKKRFGEFGEGNTAPAGKYSEPHGIAINRRGEMFICDRYNFGIHMLDAKRQPVKKWLTTGNFDSSKHFPLGITAAKNGTLYVTDNYAHAIQQYKVY